MSSDPFTREKIRRPELIFNEILRKGAQGLYKERGEVTPFLYRALVLAVDVEGGKLENPNGEGTLVNEIGSNKIEIKAKLGPANPQNSIKARILTDGIDKFASDENLRVYWPFFPENVSVPIKPGEHVYVLFEDSNLQHGLWVSKIPGHEGVNYSPGESHYKPVENHPVGSNFPDVKALPKTDKQFNKNEDAAETTSGDKLSGLKWGK